jgi:two-component system, NarL family, response regulator LiaR
LKLSGRSSSQQLEHEMDAAPPLRVLLVDDNAVFRRTILSFLDSYPDLELIGGARDGDEALEMVNRLHPAVVLMDIHLRRPTDGIAATRLLLNKCPGLAVLGLSWDNRDYVATAMQQAGALGVLAKEQTPDEMHRAILSAAASRSDR